MEKREAELQKVITFLVSKSRQQLELKAQKTQPSPFLITPHDGSARVRLVLQGVCLPTVRGLRRVFAYCVLTCLRRVLYTSENKGNVYNYSGFHLVDALSWPHAWTGAVSSKMCSHVFFQSVMAAVGQRGGCRDS